MASLPRQGRDVQRRTNKEKIKLHISQGMGLAQIREELQNDGTRITTQLNESIVWEMRFPEVEELLLQGFDVIAIEERMRSAGWIWTPNLRSKALWEYHKDEIIELYKRLRSVDSVQVVMAKKGFPPQARIYYEWLHDWNVSTRPKPNRINPVVWPSNESTSGSAGATTPVSIADAYQPTHDIPEWTSPEASTSPLSDTITNGDPTSTSMSSNHPFSLAPPVDRRYINIHNSSRGLIDIDENLNTGNFIGPPYLDIPDFRERQINAQNLRSITQNLAGTSTNANIFPGSNINSRSNEGQESSGPENTSEIDASGELPSDTIIVAPSWYDQQGPNAFRSGSEHRTSLTLDPTSWNYLAMNQLTVDSSISHRHDSGIVSGTSSTQASALDIPYMFPALELRNDSSQNSDYQGWPSLETVIHSMACENHQGIRLNYDCCGSSCLQDLAFSVKRLPLQALRDHLCHYKQYEGIRQYDYAGNTFLHKLAILGAPWEYFQAAINAGINPLHLNAYCQTFAHVLNISELHDNLIGCLSLIRGLGIDFSQRDASGWTILHCLFSQPISPMTANEILKFVDRPGRDLSLRDVLDRTPYQMFKQSLRRQASASPRWNSPELERQILGIFEDTIRDGVLRLGSENIDWQGDIGISTEASLALQSQYQEVVNRAREDIVVEALDGSNAFHAQAGLIIAQDVATDVDCIKHFITLGINANDYDNRGRTPLEAIITQPRNYENELIKAEKVALLIDKGRASVYSRNRLGHTPLYSAAIRGLDRTVEVLLRHSSHVNVRANDNVSLLTAVETARQRAFVEYQESRIESRYYEAQCSRIEACKGLLERSGAVFDPKPAQSMGYPSRRPVLH